MAGAYGESIGTWTADSAIAAASVAAGSASSPGDARSNDSQTGTEVSVACTYGGTITGGGLIVYICKEYDTGSYQAIADSPYNFQMAITASTTIRTVFIVPPSVGKYKVMVFNPATNSTVTVTVKHRPHTGVYN